MRASVSVSWYKHFPAEFSHCALLNSGTFLFPTICSDKIMFAKCVFKKILSNNFTSILFLKSNSILLPLRGLLFEKQRALWSHHFCWSVFVKIIMLQVVWLYSLCACCNSYLHTKRGAEHFPSSLCKEKREIEQWADLGDGMDSQPQDNFPLKLSDIC